MCFKRETTNISNVKLPKPADNLKLLLQVVRLPVSPFLTILYLWLSIS
jgi:hypothetical protein